VSTAHAARRHIGSGPAIEALDPTTGDRGEDGFAESSQTKRVQAPIR
jgi:hypothetical protein